MKHKELLNFVLGVLVGFTLGFLLFTYIKVSNPVKEAEASVCLGTEWGEWQYKEDVSECLPVAECGTSEGTKIVKEKRECEWTCGGQFNCVLGNKQYREVEVKCEVETPDCPEPTPELSPIVVEQSKPSGGGETPQDPACRDLGGYSPTITDVSRVDSDTVRVCYTRPSDNADAYLIWYGTSESNLSWNTTTTDLCAELSGNELVNTHVWFKVAGKSEGCVGNFSVVTDP